MIDIKTELNKSFSSLFLIEQESAQEVVLSLPYLDRYNDWISVKITEENDSYILSDCSFVFNDLLDAGINVDSGLSGKYSVIFQTICSNFGCKLNQDTKEIISESRKDSLVESIICFAQAVTSLDFLAYNTQV